MVFPTGQSAGYAIDTLLSFCFNSVKTPIVQNRNSKRSVSVDQSVEKFPERPAPFFYTCSSSRAFRHRHTSTGTVYRRRLASRSDSSRQRMSFSRTGGSQEVSTCVCVCVCVLRLRGVVGISSRMCKCFVGNVPGPLTLRIMERVESSMNSTRT